MNWKIFNQTVDAYVYRPRQPHLFGLDDLAAAGIIGAGVTGIGNLLNFSSQKSANKTNLQAVKETNQANLELYNRQFADTYKLWQENNQYNDPSAQIARLRKAGLNPQLALGSDPAGTATAASAPSANPMIAGRVQAPMVNFSDVGNIMAAVGSTMKSTSEAAGQQINNQFLRQMNIQEIARKSAEIDSLLQGVKKGSAEESYLRAQKVMLDLQYRLQSETYDEQKQSFGLQNAVLRQQSNVMFEQAKAFASESAFKDAQTVLAGIDVQYKPAQLQAAIRETMQSVALMASNMKVNDETVKKIYFEAVKEMHVAGQESVNHAIANKTVDYVIEQAKKSLNKTDEEIKNMRQTRYLNYLGVAFKPFEMINSSVKSLSSFGGK